MERSQELLEIISKLLLKGHEGSYWDYKSDYPDTKEDKLHDIICMANNLEDRDAYLIHGAVSAILDFCLLPMMHGLSPEIRCCTIWCLLFWELPCQYFWLFCCMRWESG